MRTSDPAGYSAADTTTAIRIGPPPRAWAWTGAAGGLIGVVGLMVTATSTTLRPAPSRSVGIG